MRYGRRRIQHRTICQGALVCYPPVVGDSRPTLAPAGGRSSMMSTKAAGKMPDLPPVSPLYHSSPIRPVRRIVTPSANVRSSALPLVYSNLATQWGPLKKQKLKRNKNINGETHSTLFHTTPQWMTLYGTKKWPLRVAVLLSYLVMVLAGVDLVGSSPGTGSVSWWVVV